MLTKLQRLDLLLSIPQVEAYSPAHGGFAAPSTLKVDLIIWLYFLAACLTSSLILALLVLSLINRQSQKITWLLLSLSLEINKAFLCSVMAHRPSLLLLNPLVFGCTSPAFTLALIYFCFISPFPFLHWCMQSPTPSFPLTSSSLFCFPLQFDSLQLSPKACVSTKKSGPHQNDKAHGVPKSHYDDFIP